MGWVKNKVNDVIKKYETCDPFEVAALMHIHVIPWDLHEEILGYYKYDKKNKYIVINNKLNRANQRFVFTHELGHAVLHPKANTPFMRKNTLFSIDKIEREANRFAVEFLLPDECLLDYQNTNLSIQQICEMHGIPKELSHLKKIL
ncbi:ImmA/IrrE family metallo-endopeptidase [Metabacillus fastidiosus]|uniref:ImmA/IrrE family metallo-endopeptidase n=1 Tax=Metabacillus fastidiosus TaxID=1458 RepID=UPI002E1FF9B9|nr:ImmA/IrrE family metallo-endopeptidase [Metabacillus fastidiosus]